MIYVCVQGGLQICALGEQAVYVTLRSIITQKYIFTKFVSSAVCIMQIIEFIQDDSIDHMWKLLV
jgi:type III secretory pathway component EscS